MKFGTALGDHQRISRDRFGFAMKRQLKTVGHNCLHHSPPLQKTLWIVELAQTFCSRLAYFQIDIEFFRIEPTRSSRNLRIFHSISKLNDSLQGEVCSREFVGQELIMVFGIARFAWPD